MECIPYCRNKKELAIFEKMLAAWSFTITTSTPTSLQARRFVQQYALNHLMEMGNAL